MARVIAYVRVSTDKQDLENQRFEIERFCKEQQIYEVTWIEEVVSGSKDFASRQFNQIIQGLGRGDVLIVSEVSRISRRMLDVMEFLKVCINRGATIKTVKERFVFGDDINSQVMAFAFGLAAEIERRLISQRTKEALARKKAEGVKLGRPAGTYHDHHRKLHGREEEIRALLDKRVSVAAIARVLDVHRETLARFIHDRNLRWD